MKRNLLAICGAAALLLGVTNANAQIVYEEGAPMSWGANKNLPLDVPSAKMPVFDQAAMEAEDVINDQHKIGPWRFAYEHMVNLNIHNSGSWETLKKGDRVWRMGVYSPGALSLNVIFDEFYMPEGGKVWIYNEDRSQVLGPFTQGNNKDFGSLATSPVFNDQIFIEYYEPAEVAGQGALSIGQVNHGYRDIMGYAQRVAEKGFGDSGSCNNNVICPEGDNWRCQIKSVAIITVNGSGACTGTVLNNTAEDETPYFLTADHCLGGSTANWVFVFNWDSPSCSPTQNAPTSQSVSGATTLVASGGSDVALLELSSNIPAAYDVFYSGWDASGASPTSQVGIHHPAGDIKKISFDTDPAPQGTFGGAQCWNVQNWEDGTTEPGSSGSGLWDQNGRLIGQLYGGSASCSSITDDYYGRLDVSWNAGLDQYLDPSGGSTTIMDGMGQGACAGQTFTLDATIQSIDDVDPTYCNETSIMPTVVLKNNGTDPLTSCTINWDWNGNTGSQPWTGNLTTGQTDNISLGTLFFTTSGAQSLQVWTSAPNGGTDELPSNDSKTEGFTAILNGTTVTVNITTDNYGSETSWEVTDGSGNVVYTGGPYSDGTDGQTESVDLCLEENECYNFTINDSYGDGICCDWGNGAYEVVDATTGTTYASGGQFADTETTNFCVEVGINEYQTLEGVSIFPNPTAGNVTVDMSQVTESEVTVTIYNAVGAIISTERLNNVALYNKDLSNQSAGLYFVEVRTATGVSVQKLNIRK